MRPIQILTPADEALPDPRALLKTYFRVALSCIADQRELVDDANFLPSSIAGVRLNLLRPTDNEAIGLGNWIQDGIFSAIENDHLRRLSFGIYQDAQCCAMIEQYDMVIDFHDAALDGVPLEEQHALRLKSRELIDNDTVQIALTLQRVIDCLAPLPTDYFVATHAVYTEDAQASHVRYPSYNHRGFNPQAKFGADFAESDVDSVKIGEIRTQFHTFTLNMKISRVPAIVVKGSCEDTSLPSEAIPEHYYAQPVEEMEQVFENGFYSDSELGRLFEETLDFLLHATAGSRGLTLEQIQAHLNTSMEEALTIFEGLKKDQCISDSSLSDSIVVNKPKARECLARVRKALEGANEHQQLDLGHNSNNHNGSLRLGANHVSGLQRNGFHMNHMKRLLLAEARDHDFVEDIPERKASTKELLSETHGKLFKRTSMLLETDRPVVKAGIVFDDTEETEKLLKQVFLKDNGPPYEMTGQQILEILQTDNELYEPRLGDIVRRAPFKRMLTTQGREMPGPVPSLYKALERLAKLGCVQLESCANGKKGIVNFGKGRAFNYDENGNLKSDCVARITKFGKNFVKNPISFSGTKAVTQAVSEIKDNKRKREILDDDSIDYVPNEDKLYSQGTFKKAKESIASL